jgi:hypothetical protein
MQVALTGAVAARHKIFATQDGTANLDDGAAAG